MAQEIKETWLIVKGQKTTVVTSVNSIILKDGSKFIDTLEKIKDNFK